MRPSISTRSPLVTGAVLALASAAAFGATTPLIARYGAQAGPWTTAALLYLGAAAAAAASMRPAPLTSGVLRRSAVAGIIGAMLAPAALAWGIAHTGALSASLALALESVFTVGIASAVFHEAIGRRVVLALAAIAAGSALLLVGGVQHGAGAGLAAVALATFLWAVDNALTGTVAHVDSSSIVAIKSAAGIAGSIAVALIVKDRWPNAVDAVVLAATGAVGYGLSLRWYLLAQRTFGIARTASVFASAPLIGALGAFALGDRTPATPAWIAGVLLIVAGIALHVTERHAHRHRHERERHAHVHRHDDGHHDHTHPFPVDGAHDHVHDHAALVHAHAHAPDVHHAHDHDHARQ